MYIGAYDGTYRVFTAGESLGGAFKAVSLDENGLKIGGDVPVGLTAAEVETIAAGEPCNTLVEGIGYWTAGEELDGGDLLASDSLGSAVIATSGKYVFARALDDALKGEACKVLITNAGKL